MVVEEHVLVSIITFLGCTVEDSVHRLITTLDVGAYHGVAVVLGDTAIETLSMEEMVLNCVIRDCSLLAGS